ncbi:hypothetical protein PUN28_009126 [Cardiocondyla obscurior]|uniref:C-type lectin domain-containing protein n=1 Tax=Cardiocondyla obscurior TaxID=286306 RepID=A0AAW2FWE8_9HYME
MFKYFLIVLVCWVFDDATAEFDWKPNPPYKPFDMKPFPFTPSLKLDKQNDTASSGKTVTMNGDANYNVGQQIFYVYDNQFFKRLLYNREDGSFVTSDSSDTHRLYPYKLTWNKARQACIQNGGHLAIINSESEEMILSQMLQEKNLDTAWLGLHDLYEEGDWVTIMDQPIQNTGFTGWTNKWPNEPDNWNGDQHCAILIKKDGMDDVNCKSMHYYFCEFPA